MAIQVTERWSDRRQTYSHDLHQWQAQRVFEVSSCNNEAVARAAVTGAFGVYLGGPHDLSNVMVCTSMDPVQTGFRFWRVPCVWTIPCGGVAPSSDDPLHQPIKISWVPGSWSEPSEIDAVSVPMLNMAGDPFDPPATIEYPTMVLVVKQWAPFFDPIRASNYQNAINSDTFTIQGNPQRIVVPPGQCRCKGIFPMGEYCLSSHFVEQQYRFEFRPNNTALSKVPGDAWDIRRLNQGFNGWYKDSKTGATRGRLWKNNAEISTPELLDQSGKPVDPGVTVQGETPIANPNPPRNGKDVRIETQKIGKFQQVFLHYRRGVPRPFSGLV
jgi:hypothetical protein